MRNSGPIAAFKEGLGSRDWRGKNKEKTGNKGRGRSSGGARVFAARGKRPCCRLPPHPVAYLEI